MNEEKLLTLVEAYRELYDSSDRNYHNQVRRDNVWEAIGGEMGQSGEVCREKWTKLRDCYRKSLKGRKTKSGLKPWRLEKKMAFLRPFICDRQAPNAETIDENSQFSETNNSDDTPLFVDDLNAIKVKSEEVNVQEDHAIIAPTKKRTTRSTSASQRNNKRPANSSLADLFKAYIQNKKKKPRILEKTQGDHLNKYFESVEETVRTFPAPLQIEAKRKISKIIHALEAKSFTFLNTSPGNSREFFNSLSTHYSHSSSSSPENVSGSYE